MPTKRLNRSNRRNMARGLGYAKDLKEARKRLGMSRKEYDRYLATIAHDLLPNSARAPGR